MSGLTKMVINYIEVWVLSKNQCMAYNGMGNVPSEGGTSAILVTKKSLDNYCNLSITGDELNVAGINASRIEIYTIS